jgi:hypothetical protein
MRVDEVREIVPLFLNADQDYDCLERTTPVADLELSFRTPHGRRYGGCNLSFVPTNVYRDMIRRFDRRFRSFPTPSDWIDRTAAL